MDGNNQELSTTVQEAVSVDSLVQEHRMLDDKVSELSDRSFLTSDDHMELARLKKEKLRIKDRIAQLSSQRESA